MYFSQNMETQRFMISCLSQNCRICNLYGLSQEQLCIHKFVLRGMWHKPLWMLSYTSQANPLMGICFCMITVRLNLRARQKTAPSAQYSGNSSRTAGSGSQRTTPKKVVFDPDDVRGSEDSGPVDLSKIPLSPIRSENKVGGDTVNHVV